MNTSRTLAVLLCGASSGFGLALSTMVSPAIGTPRRAGGSVMRDAPLHGQGS